MTTQAQTTLSAAMVMLIAAGTKSCCAATLSRRPGRLSHPYDKVYLMMIYEILSVRSTEKNYASFSTMAEAQIAFEDKVRFPDNCGYRIWPNVK